MSAGIIKSFIILGIIFCSFGLVIYKIFISPTVTVAPTSQDTAVVVDTNDPGQVILNLVEKMKSISIDLAFFTSPLFINLRDTSNPILPEEQGRQNPFESIGGDNLAVPVGVTKKTETANTKTNNVRSVSF